MPLVALLTALLALVPTSRAQEAPPASAPSHELRNTGALFLSGEFLGSVFLGFLGPDLVLAPQPESLTCADAWCEPPGIDRAFNRWTALSQPRAAGHVSHVFTIGFTPVVAIGGAVWGAARYGKAGYAAADTVIMLNAFMISTGINSLAKVGARRQRPAHHFDREDRTEAAEHPDEEFLSFYSGDTTWAWTLAGAGTSLAYLRGYRHARWVAIGSGTLAFVGSFLRMAADMHWLTDVLVGAAVGTAVGVGLPILLHRRRPSDRLRGRVSLSPLAGPGRVGLHVSAPL